MDQVQASMVFVALHLICLGIGITPGTSWWKVGVFGLYLGLPVWFAWVTGLWPFYFISITLLIVFVGTIIFKMGEAYNDAND